MDGTTLAGVMLCLQALAKMRTRWSHIPAAVRRTLLEGILREAPSPASHASFSVEGSVAKRAQAVAVIIHSIGKLNGQWSQLDLDFFPVTLT
jgi:CRISPR/Cas system-associated endonuclease Cas3-HD